MSFVGTRTKVKIITYPHIKRTKKYPDRHDRVEYIIWQDYWPNSHVNGLVIMTKEVSCIMKRLESIDCTVNKQNLIE